MRHQGSHGWGAITRDPTGVPCCSTSSIWVWFASWECGWGRAQQQLAAGARRSKRSFQRGVSLKEGRGDTEGLGRNKGGTGKVGGRSAGVRKSRQQQVSNRNAAGSYGASPSAASPVSDRPRGGVVPSRDGPLPVLPLSPMLLRLLVLPAIPLRPPGTLRLQGSGAGATCTRRVQA